VYTYPQQVERGYVIMKKIAVVLVIAAIALYAMPVFAGDAPAGQEKSFFQTISDEINNSKMPARFAVKPVAKDTADGVKYIGDSKVAVFQDISDGIAQGSAKAKNESLRTK